IFLVVAGETLKQVGIAARALKDFGQDGFGAVAHIFKHFAYTALKVEAHDHEAPRTALSTRQWRRVAPERAYPAHDRCTTARVRMTEQPYLVNQVVLDLAKNIKLLHEPKVIHGIGFVKAACLESK